MKSKKSDLEKRREYMRKYMRAKRLQTAWKIIMNNRKKFDSDTFNKYFTFFEQYFRENYIIPTTREILGHFNSQNTKWVDKFNAELVSRWFIIKRGSSFAPTKALMRLIFWIT